MEGSGVNAAPAVDHLVKSIRFLRTARTLLHAGDGEAVISACYYACLHVAEAALATRGIAADTHRGVRQLLSLHFIKDGPLTAELGRDYGRLMSDRGLADYGLGAPLSLAAAGNSVRLAISVLRPMLMVLRDTGEPGVAGVAAAVDDLEAQLAPDAPG